MSYRGSYFNSGRHKKKQFYKEASVFFRDIRASDGVLPEQYFLRRDAPCYRSSVSCAEMRPVTRAVPLVQTCPLLPEQCHLPKPAPCYQSSATCANQSPVTGAVFLAQTSPCYQSSATCANQPPVTRAVPLVLTIDKTLSEC